MHAPVKAIVLWLKHHSQNYLVGARRKKILAGLKTVDSIDCVNVEHHGMSMSKITMH